MARFGVREICDVKLRKINTDGSPGEPVLYLESLKVSTLEATTESVKAMGGVGNPTILSWESTKTVNFNCESAVASLEGLALSQGTTVTTGAQLIPKKEFVTLAATTGTVTLEETPSYDDGFFVYESNDGVTIGTAVDTTVADVSGAVFTKASHEGQTVIIDYYYTSEATANSFVFNTTGYGDSYYLEAKTLWRRTSDAADIPATIIIPKAKLNTGIEIAMQADGDPSVFSFALEAQKPDNSTELVKIILEE